MSDEPESPPEAPAPVDPQSDKSKREYRDYSIDDRYEALAAVTLNGGNIYRTAKAYGIPYSTLYQWVEERNQRGGALTKIEKEKRGDLASKLEHVVHSAVELASSPAKLAQATYLQLMTGAAIGIDKLKVLRGQGLDPDPVIEVCRILGINRSQLPERLELKPGDEIPVSLLPLLSGRNPIIETSLVEPSLDSAGIELHSPACAVDQFNNNCSCGAHARNQAKLKEDEESQLLNSIPDDEDKGN